MTKKIRLIDEGVISDTENNETPTTNAPSASTETVQIAQMLKYAEAIDWKLWEILKILKNQTGED